MCPECWLSVGGIVSGAISTGGMSALAVRIFRAKKTITHSIMEGETKDGYRDER